MGQKNGKYQATSNLRKSSLRKKRVFSVVPHALSPDQHQSFDDTIAEQNQTGNLIISIHMLTMNSNEVNSNNSCRSVTGSCMNNAPVEISAGSTCSSNNSKQSVDQSNNDKQVQLINNQGVNASSASSSVCKKFNSKYNKATLIAKSPVSEQESNSVTCDNQSNVINNNEVSSSTPSSSTNNFRLSGCPLADKLSSMLGSKCRFGSGASATTKVKKGILGKFKSSGAKQKQKSREDETKVMSTDEGNASLNTSSSSNASDKADTPCTHCTGTSHRSDDNSNQSSGMSLTYGNTTNPVLFPTNTSYSITSGGTATTGQNATAIILPDSTLLHSNGFPALYGSLNNGTSGGNFILVSSLFDMARLSSDDSLEDCDEQARIRRARQIAEGVEAPPGFIPSCSSNNTTSSLQNSHLQTLLCSIDPLHSALRNRLLSQQSILFGEEYPRVHSQADYIHCLVPDLKKITSCCFYWGKMDRYEAEKLLDGKPEGTFLLRDSAQEEFLFSVSFRKYGRSLHARIEQFNHQFSFDSHDPGVYTATTVTGLLEHYKDPSCVMFFEPMLTLPLNRNFVFSLQELTRATIVSHTTYDGIDQLCVPKMFKSYLKEYHYKQRVHVKRLDDYQDT